jgi:hypothetical protein
MIVAPQPDLIVASLSVLVADLDYGTIAGQTQLNLIYLVIEVDLGSGLWPAGYSRWPTPFRIVDRYSAAHVA